MRDISSAAVSAVFAAVTLWGQVGFAATFTVVADKNRTERCDIQTGTSPVTGGCTTSRIDVAGRAGMGSLGVRASVLAPFSTGGSVSASISDELSFSVSDGQLIIPVDIFGTFTTDLSGPFAGGASAVSSVSLSTSTGTLFTRQLVETAVVKEFRDSVGVFGANLLSLDIVDGKATLSASLSAGAFCSGSFFEDATCSASANSFSSARFLAGTVFDNTGAEVVGASVKSSSGFDYLVGVQPHDISAVPLPASVWLLGLGMSGLIGVSRKSRVSCV